MYKRRATKTSIYVQTPSSNVIYLFINEDQSKNSCVYFKLQTSTVLYLITNTEQVN